MIEARGVKPPSSTPPPPAKLGCRRSSTLPNLDEGETFGLSCFLRDDSDAVYHTYFTTDRGVEPVDTNFALLDWTVLGRQETWEDSPPGWPQTKPFEWWRRHDEYE